jgi:hypothetical protein
MTIISDIVASVFGGANELREAFLTDNADLIEEKLALFTLPFGKIFLSYVVALRVLPLMASEFCGHYFSSAFAGNPISEHVTQLLSGLKNKTVGKVAKYGKDVAKHQIDRYFNK